jgi:coiled-coil domain-containing protein 130
MSSLAATQADGYYIPSSYYTSGAYKKQSVNQHAGSKGHNQFLTRSIARFELPYDGFCTNCQAIVGKGTRFNAHKAHVGDYFTSKIYEFTIKCRACAACEFKIRTNPKEQSFDYVSGIRKKVEEFDSAEAGTLGVIDTDAGAGIYQYKNGKLVGADDKANDTALYALEKSARGERKAMTEYEQMESLYKINTRMEEDADANAALRSGYRKERNAKKQRLEDAKKMGLGLGISLVGETEQDIANAKVAIGLRDHDRVAQQAYGSEKEKFSSIRSGSIFSSKNEKQSRRVRVKSKKYSNSKIETNSREQKRRSLFVLKLLRMEHEWKLERYNPNQQFPHWLTMGLTVIDFVR